MPNAAARCLTVSPEFSSIRATPLRVSAPYFLGRPPVRPSALDRSRPRAVRSAICSRSISATAPKIPIIIRPVAELVSIDSLKNLTVTCCFDRVSTNRMRSVRFRPSLERVGTITSSSGRNLLSISSRAGRDLFAPLTPASSKILASLTPDCMRLQTHENVTLRLERVPCSCLPSSADTRVSEFHSTLRLITQQRDWFLEASIQSGFLESIWSLLVVDQASLHRL
jgi:hypothetical protein